MFENKKVDDNLFISEKEYDYLFLTEKISLSEKFLKKLNLEEKLLIHGDFRPYNLFYKNEYIIYLFNSFFFIFLFKLFHHHYLKLVGNN